MIKSLNSGVSGMQQFQTRMDVIGNNIANINTTGFKSARVDFADSFSQTLRQASPGNSITSGTAAIQVGSGVTTSAIKNQFTQGALARTSVPTDLGISGDGFFMVRDTLTNAQFASRAGDFRVDENGYIITNSGLRLQGYADSALSSIDDLKIDTAGAPATADPAASVASFSISLEGKINVRMSDGTEFVRGQVLLQKFNDPQALVKEGVNLYSGIGSAGPLGGASSPTPAAPGSSGLGRIESGALELSNVDLASEFASLITTQRAFQASARIITTSDEMLQELVNLQR